MTTYVLIISLLLFLFAGMGIISILYMSYRKITKGRIIVYIYTEDRQLKRYTARPDAQGLITINKRTYAYRERAVLRTTGFLLREPTVALLYKESKALPAEVINHKDGSVAIADRETEPLDPYEDFETGKMGEEDLSADELASILNARIVREFVQAMNKVGPQQIALIVIGMGLVSALISSTATYYIVKFLVLPAIKGG